MVVFHSLHAFHLSPRLYEGFPMLLAPLRPPRNTARPKFKRNTCFFAARQVMMTSTCGRKNCLQKKSTWDLKSYVKLQTFPHKDPHYRGPSVKLHHDFRRLSPRFSTSRKLRISVHLRFQNVLAGFKQVPFSGGFRSRFCVVERSNKFHTIIFFSKKKTLTNICPLILVL